MFYINNNPWLKILSNFSLFLALTIQIRAYSLRHLLANKYNQSECVSNVQTRTLIIHHYNSQMIARISGDSLIH